MPDFSLEDKAGGMVCGLDEAGRGPLAGPVVAACVYIPPEKRRLDFVSKINDSKQLPHHKREELFILIQEHCVIGIAESSSEEIDSINILQASMRAMGRAFAIALKNANGVTALIDGNHVPRLPCLAMPVVKGDSRSFSIAAASILAKVTRDRLMQMLAIEHPYYGWERNAGYPSPAHIRAIDRHGITPHHRKSYEPVRNFLAFGTTQRQISFAV